MTEHEIINYIKSIQRKMEMRLLYVDFTEDEYIQAVNDDEEYDMDCYTPTEIGTFSSDDKDELVSILFDISIKGWTIMEAWDDSFISEPPMMTFLLVQSNSIEFNDTNITSEVVSTILSNLWENTSDEEVRT